jgi:formate hydrogenlyase transcriptional activator
MNGDEMDDRQEPWQSTPLDIYEAHQPSPYLEAQLQAILNVVPEYTWYASLSGCITFVNRRTADYLGLSKDDPLRFGRVTREAWDIHIPLLHPDDHDRTRIEWSTWLRTGCAGEVRFRVRNAQGVYRWFLSRAEPFRASDGTVLYWVGVSLDIEDLRQAEFYLAEGQRLAHMGNWAFNSAGFDYWSPELFQIHGLAGTGKPPTKQEYLSLVHPEDRVFVTGAIQKMFAHSEGFDLTKRIVRPDGQIRYIRCVGTPAIEMGRATSFVGIGMDVTEQEQLTQGLRGRRTYLAEAQRLTHADCWVWNEEDRAATLSEECYRIYGFDPAEGSPAWERRLEQVHPEDRLKLKDTIERAILEKADYDVDFRFQLPDGKVKWIHTVGHPVLTSSGDLVEFLGSSTDITERRQAEQKLKEQEMELRQMLDLTPQYLGVLGADGRPIYANRASLDYLGMTLEEWQQRGAIGNEVHPDDAERVKTELERAISTGVAVEIEERVRRGDGSFRWILSRCSPVRDKNGQLTRLYLASVDIHDRKTAEERLRQENAALREELDKASMFEEIIGTSPALKAVLTDISMVAPSDSTVLITGETGSGKELVARAIHRRSPRSSRAFVSVNCAAIPRDLMASELFGHERGAFTGAIHRRLGRFELADGGTIFLDEVGELLPDTQAALLRVLQEREFDRVGGTQPIHVDIRVIAATNRELNQALANGTFRPDLFFRLNVFPIEVPPLRERKEDIVMLVEYFVHRYATRTGKHLQSIDKKTLELLQSYDWPGNIRELQNVIERSVILSSDGTFAIDGSWLSKEPRLQDPQAECFAPFKEGPEPISEREIIEAALAACRGRVSGTSGAAARLGIPPSTLDHRIKALKINKLKFKFR